MWWLETLEEGIITGTQRDSAEQERGKYWLDDQSFGNYIEDVLVPPHHGESSVAKTCPTCLMPSTLRPCSFRTTKKEKTTCLSIKLISVSLKMQHLHWSIF